MTHLEEAELSYRLFGTYRNDRQEWLDKRLKEYQFAMGQQWTTDESAELEARGQVDYVWNRIYPYLRHYESLLTSRTPEAQLIPAGDVDKELVVVMNDVMKYILHISYWPQQFRRTVKSLLNKGVGWMWVHPDPFSSGGMGDIKVDYVNFQDVYVPKDASAIFYDDAESIILSRIIPLVDAKMLYPKVAGELERESFSGRDDTEHKTSMLAEKEREEPYGPQETPGSPEFKNVRIIHRFTKERKKVWRVLNILTSEEREVGEDEPKDLGPEEETAPYLKTSVRMITSAGANVYIGEEVFPIEDWPLIPFVYEDTENPYPISAVTLHQGQQKLLNKFASLMLYNTQVSTGPKIITVKGAIDKGVWADEFGLPGSINEMNAGYSIREHLHVVQISPIPSAMFAMAEDIKRELSYETSSAPFHQGSSEGMPPTLGQTLTLKEESTRRMGPVIQQVDMSLQRMYEVKLQFIPYVYDAYRLITIIDSESLEPKNFAINEPKLDEETGKILEVLNDLTKFRARVMVRTASSVEPSRVAYLTLFSQLVQQFPILARHMLRYMDLPNSQQIQDELDENAQLRQAIESYGDQMEELQQLIGRLQETVLDEKEQVKLQKIQARLDAFAVRAEAQIQIQAAARKEKTKPER